MNHTNGVTESQQLLSRIARSDSRDRVETSIVTSPGARVTSWAVKIKSNCGYNVYNVSVVQIGEPCTMPTEIGGQLTAVNLAESFMLPGQLSAGTYAVMSKVGEKNVICVSV